MEIIEDINSQGVEKKICHILNLFPEKLSNEMWNLVFDFLGPDPYQLAEIAKVCRLFRALANCHASWRKICNLGGLEVEGHDYRAAVIRSIGRLCSRCGMLCDEESIAFCKPGSVPMRLCFAQCLQAVWTRYCKRVLSEDEFQDITTPIDRGPLKLNDTQDEFRHTCITNAHASIIFQIPCYVLNFLPLPSKDVIYRNHSRSLNQMSIYQFKHAEVARNFFHGSKEKMDAYNIKCEARACKFSDHDSILHFDKRRLKLYETLKPVHGNLIDLENFSFSESIDNYIETGIGLRNAVEDFSAHWTSIVNNTAWSGLDERMQELKAACIDDTLFQCIDFNSFPAYSFIVYNWPTATHIAEFYSGYLIRMEKLEETVAEISGNPLFLDDGPIVGFQWERKNVFLLSDYLRENRNWEGLCCVLRRMKLEREDRSNREQSLTQAIENAENLTSNLRIWSRFCDYGSETLEQVVESLSKYGEMDNLVTDDDRRNFLKLNVADVILELPCVKAKCMAFIDDLNETNLIDLMEYIKEIEWFHDNVARDIRNFDKIDFFVGCDDLKPYVASSLEKKSFILPQLMSVETPNRPPSSLWYMIENLFKKYLGHLIYNEDVEDYSEPNQNENFDSYFDRYHGDGTSVSVKFLLKIDNLEKFGKGHVETMKNLFSIFHALFKGMESLKTMIKFND